MASIADQEDKESLQKALKFINKPPTGSLDGDVHALADAIAKYAQYLCVSQCALTRSLQTG